MASVKRNNDLEACGNIKRKRGSLTILQKVEILRKLDNGVSVQYISDTYGIGKTTVYDIKNSKEKILNMFSKSESNTEIATLKTFREARFAKLDAAIYDWFKQRRREGLPVTGLLLREKGKQLHNDLRFEEECNFTNGWLRQFKKRHGIRFLNYEQNTEDGYLDIINEKKEDPAETAPILHHTVLTNKETSPQQKDVVQIYYTENFQDSCLSDDSSEKQEFRNNEEVILQSVCSNRVCNNVNLGPESNNQAIAIKKLQDDKDKVPKSMLTKNKQLMLTKSPTWPPPIYLKPQAGNSLKNASPWETLEDSYLAVTSSNRELLIKLVNEATRRQKNMIDQFRKLPLQWTDFEIDKSEPSIFALGEKIAYSAIVADYCEHPLTLVISVNEKRGQFLEQSEIKYPVLGKFKGSVPSTFINNLESEADTVSATVLILDRSVMTTIVCFCDNLPGSLTDDLEKEFCFIILQLIQSMKSLQAQGVEYMDTDFQNLLLAKTKQDKYHTLIFLYDIYDENDYSSDACKVSLCQYALLLLFQLLQIKSPEECKMVNFSTTVSQKVFEKIIALLSEEKAMSLSQTKTLLECYLWGITKVLEKFQDSKECENVLRRWFDVERSNFIKCLINNEESGDINMRNEYYSQFLIRTTVRSIKDIAFCL